MTVIEESLGFGLVVGQIKQLGDLTMGTVMSTIQNVLTYYRLND